MAVDARGRAPPPPDDVPGHRRRPRVGDCARFRPCCWSRSRSTRASPRATGATRECGRRRSSRSAPCRPSAPGCAVTPRSGSRGASRPTMRMKLVAHLQRLHFAFHDHAQTGQLMAYANTDIQQVNNVDPADPAHDREHDPDGRGRRSSSSRSTRSWRCSRSARCRCSTSRRRGSTSACSRSAWRCRRSSRSCRASSRRASPGYGS